MTSMRRPVAVFVLLLAATLGFGTAYRTVAAYSQTCSNQNDCDGQGAGGGAGGCGGGMCPGGGGGGNSHGETGEPPNGGGNGSATGGSGGPGNGSNGDSGGNNIRTPTPAPTAAFSSSSGSSSGSSKTSSASVSGPTPAPDASLEAWARQLNTTPEEIQSWFGDYTAADTIGGQANAISAHPDDQVTIFDGATTSESDGTGTGARRMGIHGIGGTRTKGGDGVDISMHSTAVPLGSTVTDAGGAFTANVQVPHDTSTGRHFIIALAPNVKGGRAAFVFPVSIEAVAAAAPAADTPSEPAQTGKRFPWVLFELIVGSVSVVALFVYRVRRAAA